MDNVTATKQRPLLETRGATFWTLLLVDVDLSNFVRHTRVERRAIV